jgi:hypothetical protein
MAIMKRVLQPQSHHHKKVLKELKALFKRERCLIPMVCQECDFEGKILLGCELLRSYIQQKTKREARRHDAFEYPAFVICGLFENGNRLLYGVFSEIGFERDAMFVGEYQWRLNAERRRGVIG